MKVAVIESIGNIALKEVDNPKVPVDSILIRVEACAICGSDLRIVYGKDSRAKFPMIIGHEMAGIVEQLGHRVKGFKEGDRVTVAPGVSCGKCRMCKRGLQNLCENMISIGYFYPGGFAQYMVPPPLALTQGFVNKIPENLSLDEATMAEPLACCINGQEIVKITKEDTVAIIGAGSIGCMHVELCHVGGCKKIILLQRSQPRLDIAKEKFHADVYINTSRENGIKRVLEETDGYGTDVVIVATPSGQAQKQALQLVAKRGRVSFFGGLPHDDSEVCIDTNVIHYKECFICGASSSTGKQNREALEILSAGKIKASDFITHTFSLNRIVEAFETARSKKGLRVIIKPWE
jgi:L-iditol 2-dehydrogenase